MRISRPCYDKYHRCPGWAGGGLRYPKRDRCDHGYITYLTTEPGGEKIKKLWKWRFNRCPECKVIVLPYMIRWADWRWIKYRIQGSRSVSLLDDDEGRSSDFTVNDGEQRLWIGVRPVWFGDTQGEAPVIQLSYQADRNSPLQGPVFISERTWDDLARAVEWRRRSYLPLWKRILTWMAR